jgi:uncharacterized membrane-anchored protein YhcB (DUF1043 family)
MSEESGLARETELARIERASVQAEIVDKAKERKHNNNKIWVTLTGLFFCLCLILGIAVGAEKQVLINQQANAIILQTQNAKLIEQNRELMAHSSTNATLIKKIAAAVDKKTVASKETPSVVIVTKPVYVPVVHTVVKTVKVPDKVLTKPLPKPTICHKYLLTTSCQ